MEFGVAVDPNDLVDSPVALKYGAGRATEVFVGWSPYVRATRPGPDWRGAGDVVVGARHRFLEAEGNAPSAAFQVTTKLPTAAESGGVGNGEYDFSAAGILSGSVDGLAWTTYYELGALGEQGGSGHDTSHAMAVSLGTHITQEVGCFAELAGIWVPARSENPIFTTWGLTWSEDPSIVWDLSVALGLDDDAPDAVFAVGVTRNFGRLVRREAPIN